MAWDGSMMRFLWGVGELYDPWESSGRLRVCMDLYKGPSACSVFRMFQGWLSMFETGPWEETLLINPLFDRATAYYLLRPFFEPKVERAKLRKEQYLDKDNWQLKTDMDSSLDGAYPSQCLELNDETHPHLELDNPMVHVPMVNPRDYVVWHCDSESPPSPLSVSVQTLNEKKLISHSHPRSRYHPPWQERLLRPIYPSHTLNSW